MDNYLKKIKKGRGCDLGGADLSSVDLCEDHLFLAEFKKG